jgi:hypothetical protein
LWPDVEATLFESGTAALAQALQLAFATIGASAPRTVLLPAYGCPNLVAAALWANAVPEYYDICPQTLGPAPGVLEALSAATNTVMVHVDAFGADTLPTAAIHASGPGSRLVHDLAQSYAPYAPLWRPRLPLNVLSYGRAKPLSLTLGGALLVERASDAPRESVGPVEAMQVSAWTWALRTAVYSLSLHPVVFGALARIPALRIGQTYFTPLTEVRQLPPEWTGVLAAGLHDLRGAFEALVQDTAAMVRLVGEAGVTVPESALQAQGHLPLWRVPILCPAPEQAAAIARDGAHLGISRLYARALPQIMGAPPEVATARWPNAVSIAGRLVTVPTHGRLGKTAEVELRHLLATHFRLR